jgi:aminoglycoside 3-N-acetyltransferase
MQRDIIAENQVTEQLLDLGVQPGGVLLVHCAFSQVQPVQNGPLGLIAALQAALGPAGTLVTPSLADDDEQPFDVRATPCVGMGVVAHTFWHLPGVLRSDSPHAFAARGLHAAQITAPHPIDVPHGLVSPVGRVYELNGQVLLLGVGHDADTSIHLAELLAGVRYRCQKSAYVRQEGQIVRIDYGENDHCCQNFALVDGWLDAHQLQRYGQVGHATARLVRSRDLVDIVTAKLRRNETVFLHPRGVDEECDAAWASLPT